MISLPSRALSRGAAIVVALTLLATAACTGGDGNAAAAVCAPSSTSPNGTPEATPEVPDECAQLVGLTSFATFGRDAYWYVAADQGFFGDSGLDVRTEPGFGARNISDLAAGNAQFAAIDLSSFIINMAELDENDRGFVAVAAIHQLPPAALMTVSPDIRGPQDLAGKTVAMAGGSVLELLFPAYAAQAGLDPDEVRIVDTEPGQLPSTLAGGVADAIEQFHMGLPTIQAAVGGQEVTVLEYSEYLYDLYGVVIITTRDLAQRDPALVRRFTGALLRGLAYSLDQPGEAGQILANHFEEQDPEVAAAELQVMNGYSRQAGTPLGGIDPVRVSQHIASLESIGLLDNGELVAEDIVDFDLVPTGP